MARTPLLPGREGIYPVKVSMLWLEDMRGNYIHSSAFFVSQEMIKTSRKDRVDKIAKCKTVKIKAKL